MAEMTTFDFGPHSLGELEGADRSTRDAVGTVEFPAGCWLQLSEGASGHLANLVDLPSGSIEYVGADGVELTPTDFAAIAAVPGCTRFDFDNTSFDDEAAAGFANLPITTLSLGGTNISDAGLSALSSVATLEFLFVSRTAVSDRGLATLRAHQALAFLACARTDVTPASAEVIATWPRLTELQFHEATDAVVVAAARPRTTSLHLSRATLTRRGISALDECVELESLGLPLSDLDIGACTALGELSSLRYLMLRNAAVDTFALAGALEHLNELRGLDLFGTGIGDECVAALLACNFLESLDVSETRVTDDGVAELRWLPRLTHFEAENAAVSASAIAALPHLPKPFELG